MNLNKSRVLFSTLYGSFLYGTAIPGVSDIDRKSVILPDLDDLLLGKTPKNIVQKFEGIDTEYVPIQVFAKDFLEGQTYALELAYAVKYDQAEQVVYDSRFYGFCEELRDKFLTSTMHSMVRYAVNQANLYSGKGERLNAARDFLEVLNKFGSDEGKIQDSCALQDFLIEVDNLQTKYPDYVQKTEYDQDGKGNIKPCIKVLTRIVPFSATISTAKKTVESIIAKYGARAQAATSDNVDWKAMSHALRILLTGVVLLESQNITFPYPELTCEELKGVRLGKVSFQEVQKAIEQGMSELIELEKESTLPKLTPELRNELEIWLLGWLRKFYGLES